jgi:hypothetical protein
MALRVFSTREGDEWRVWSVVPAANAAATLDDEFRGGWLCFEQVNGGERRRLPLTQAPAGWDVLPDDRLDLLRRVASLVSSPPVDTVANVTGRRPIEDAARYRRSEPTSAVGVDEQRVEL